MQNLIFLIFEAQRNFRNERFDSVEAQRNFRNCAGCRQGGNESLLKNSK